MDLPQPPRPSFERDDPVNGVAAQSEWLEIVRAISESAPGQEAALWVGQLVVEVQKASDRAVAAARVEADSIVSDARADAIRIRASGRRRARTISQMRSLMRQATTIERTPNPGASDGSVDQTPPQARSAAASAPVHVDPIDECLIARHMASPATTSVSPATTSASPAAAPSPSPAAAPSPAPVATAVPPVASSAPPPAPGRSPPTAASAPRPVPGDTRATSLPTSPRLRPAALLVAIAIIVAALGVPAFEHYGTADRERASQHQLASEFDALVAKRSTPAPPNPGDPVAVLAVPRLAIQGAVVVDGATLAGLRRGPAHETASQLPGQPGAVIILGRLRTYGGSFGRLDEMHVGDTISLRTPGSLYVYRVSANPKVLTTGSDLPLPAPPRAPITGNRNDPAGETLVLATSVSSRSASLRVVVATLDPSGTVNGTAASPTTVPSGPVVAQLGSVPGDGIGELLLLMWLAVVVAAIVLARRFRARIPPAVIYGVGSFVVLIALFQMYLAIDRLLPGTY